MYILIISLVTFFAALLTFFSGFGLGTILTPVMLIFFPPEIAISLCVFHRYPLELSGMPLICGVSFSGFTRPPSSLITVRHRIEQDGSPHGVHRHFYRVPALPDAQAAKPRLFGSVAERCHTRQEYPGPVRLLLLPLPHGETEEHPSRCQHSQH